MSSPAPIVHFSRRYRFSASHRLHVPTLTAEQNRETYGKCNNRFGHGHNYFVEVTVAGPVHAETGFVVDMPRLDALAQREIVDRFDLTYLNADTSFNGATVPSTENLVFELERVFCEAVPRLDATGKLRLVAIRVEETNNNSFELPSQQPALPRKQTVRATESHQP